MVNNPTHLCHTAFFCSSVITLAEYSLPWEPNSLARKGVWGRSAMSPSPLSIKINFAYTCMANLQWVMWDFLLTKLQMLRRGAEKKN